MKKFSGIILITILCVVPIFLWLLTFPNISEVKFDYVYVGQMLGLTGATLLSINFILSSRLKFLENLFGGLNKVYIVHHITGAIAFSMLSFHPIFIGLSYLRYSPKVMYEAIIPSTTNMTLFGVLAYLTLTTLLILTLFVNLPYHIWKLTHKFMGLALIFAFLHVYFIHSTVAYYMPLRIYMLSIMAIGIVTFFYRTIFGHISVRRYRYKVIEVNRMNNVTEIKMIPIVNTLKYSPGQFIFINFDSKEVGQEEHPFSLTSIPSDNYISISPKDSGDYTNNLKLLKVGSEALIEGAFGRFSYRESPRKKQIWIAGGIGITPFISMAKDLTAHDRFDITLYYIVSEEKEAVYLTLLKSLESKLKSNFRVITIITKSQGRLTADKIAGEIKDYKSRDIFVCGPPPMMKSLRSQFNELGIRNSHIFSEEFSLD